MEPILNDGVYVYCTVPYETSLAQLAPVATLREAEGMSLILPEAQAHAAGLAVLFRCAWITLSVHSDLHAVGLTAAFASALGQCGISCNVVAGACHDHLFVPVEQASGAMMALRRLQMGQPQPAS